jgi:rubrerythrin
MAAGVSKRQDQMTDEQIRTLDGLKMAIRMEIDGKEFYTKAASESGNELGRKLLANLAAEEDVHRRVFQDIYDAISQKKGWPKADFHADGGKGLKTVFAESMKKTAEVAAKPTELAAVKTARAMETKTYDYYKAQMARAQSPAEKEFYEQLCAQEQQHNLILADYQEYLQNPAGYFVKKEHPHLD